MFVPHAGYRFSPWWVNATALGPLVAVSALSFTGGLAAFGIVVTLAVAGFFLSACIISIAGAIVLRRWMAAIATRRHPRLLLFVILTASWIVADIASVYLTWIVFLAYNAVISSGSPVEASSPTTGLWEIDVRWFGYTSPMLALYIALSGLISFLSRPAVMRSA